MNTGGDTSLIIGIIVSFVLHVGAIGAFTAVSSKDAKAIPIKAATAVLVRKGTPRDKRLLPRIHQAPKAAAPKRRVVPKRRKPPKRRRRRRRKSLNLDDIINRAKKHIKSYRKNNEEDDPRADNSIPPGVENGSVHGTVSDPALARLGSMYGLKIRVKIEANLNIPPFFKPNEIKKLKNAIELVMFISDTGRLKRVKLSKSSGDRRFDNAVLAAVRRGSPYPAPPAKLRTAIRDGMEIGW
tara:strand:- start:5568 stop:6287 length:720 start_codon:yes stop_codon:yes gene_type:complete